jgi:hypothetical protein
MGRLALLWVDLHCIQLAPPHHAQPDELVAQLLAELRAGGEPHAEGVPRASPRRRRAGLSLPGVRLFTWTTLDVVNCCFDCNPKP